MVDATQSKAALQLVTDAATVVALDAFRAMRVGEAQAALLAAIPPVIAHYSDGSSALAVDFYMDERERQGVAGRFSASPVVLDRVVKIRRAVAWAAQEDTETRLALVVQSEVARPYRDTVLSNRRRDPESVGYRRYAGDGCQFCQMMADKGAVYRRESAYFAAHDNCNCTAGPVFRGGDVGPEADVWQYLGAKRKRSPAEKAALRLHLNVFYPR